MTAPPVAGTQSQVFGPLLVRYDARVLAPRPWTLMQSRWAADCAASAAPGPILELCAGAGHIGLAAAVLSGRRLVQVEADPVAAAYARTNAVLAGRADLVEVRKQAMQAALAVGERFPLIVADPPYLPRADLARWPDDPTVAIDGGHDGLDLVRVCLEVASRHLIDQGVLLLQVAGAVQARAVVSHLDVTGGLGLVHRETRHHDRERAIMLLASDVLSSRHADG